MTVRRFLDLSTAHLCPGTREWLDKQGLLTARSRTFHDPDVVVLLGSTPYGWFVYADEASTDEEPGPRVPADLWTCMAKARAEGCEYILFDADARPLVDLPTFEDAAPTATAPELSASVH